eukprot:390620_1
MQVLSANTPKMVLESVFKKYDNDNSGKLNFKEFSNALNDLDVTDEEEQQAIFHLADVDNGGNVCIDEFIQLIKAHEFDDILGNNDALKFINETYEQFQQHDSDGNGEITWEEYYFFLIKQPGYTHELISQRWHFLDMDKNSKITFQEFWKGYKTQREWESKQQQLKKKNNDDNDGDEKDEKKDDK